MQKQTGGFMKELNRNKVTGVTAAGWLIIVMVVLFFIYLAIKLIPVYMEYGSIKSSMTSLYEQRVGNQTPGEIKKLFQRRLDVNDIEIIKGSDAVVTATPQGKVIVVEYEKKVHLFGNVSALVEFKNEQPLQ
ncbi:MAG: DUF4845 domain-containing protein [Gammaproteobacteria bacterium]|nr:DUF4845 domain-containing protein [Gammaproteobacteria bacterium]